MSTLETMLDRLQLKLEKQNYELIDPTTEGTEEEIYELLEDYLKAFVNIINAKSHSKQDYIYCYGEAAKHDFVLGGQAVIRMKVVDIIDEDGDEAKTVIVQVDNFKPVSINLHYASMLLKVVKFWHETFSAQELPVIMAGRLDELVERIKSHMGPESLPMLKLALDQAAEEGKIPPSFVASLKDKFGL